MAHCNVPNCNWYGTKKGLAIHLAKIHKIHPQHEPGIEILTLDQAGKVVSVQFALPCPVPGCGLYVSNLLSHAHSHHETWFLSNGRFVFEVV